MRSLVQVAVACSVLLACAPIRNEAVDVFFDTANTVVSEHLALNPYFYSAADSHFLDLELFEEDSAGGDVLIAGQQVLIADTTLVTLDGPDGRPVVSVDWVTPPVTANSLKACVRVLRARHGGQLGLGCIRCRPSHRWRCAT